MLGLPPSSYEAFCFDQAANYWTSHVEAELDKIGEKKTAKQRGIETAREKALKRMLGTEGAEPTKGKFADPAMMF